MASSSSAAKNKKYDSVSLKTFRRWSFSDDFAMETDVWRPNLFVEMQDLYRTYAS